MPDTVLSPQKLQEIRNSARLAARNSEKEKEEKEMLEKFADLADTLSGIINSKKNVTSRITPEQEDTIMLKAGENIIANIQFLLEYYQMTLMEMGVYTRLSTATIHRMQSDPMSSPGLLSVLKIAYVFGLSINDLVMTRISLGQSKA